MVISWAELTGCPRSSTRWSHVNCPEGYLEFKDTYGQNFNGYTHVFEVHARKPTPFNAIGDDITGSRDIPEIDMTAAPTGSKTISAHRAARNKI